MKKFIYIIIVFFTSWYSSAQQYEFYELQRDVSFSCGAGDIADGAEVCLSDVDLYFQNGRPEGLIVSGGCNNGWNGVELVSFSNLLCGYTFNPDLDISTECYDDFISFVSIKPSTSFQVITPNPGVDNQKSIVTLEVTPGFDPEVYRWLYYSPVTSDWELLPSQFQGLSTINVTAEDLFGANASSYYGVGIEFKLELCNGWKPDVFPYIYGFIPAPPEVADITSTDETCPERNDGSLTIEFSRALFTGEEFDNIALIRPDGEITDQIFSEIYNGLTYDWPNDISAGTYKIRYQSIIDGSLSEEEESAFFTVGEPTPISFSATGSNLQCFQNGSGTIDINASGGTDSYLYSIDNGTNYTPFSNGSNHTVTGLMANNAYLVKVKDTNQCVAQD